MLNYHTSFACKPSRDTEIKEETELIERIHGHKHIHIYVYADYTRALTNYYDLICKSCINYACVFSTCDPRASCAHLCLFSAIVMVNYTLFAYADAATAADAVAAACSPVTVNERVSALARCAQHVIEGVRSYACTSWRVPSIALTHARTHARTAPRSENLSASSTSSSWSWSWSSSAIFVKDGRGCDVDDGRTLANVSNSTITHRSLLVSCAYTNIYIYMRSELSEFLGMSALARGCNDAYAPVIHNSCANE